MKPTEKSKKPAPIEGEIVTVVVRDMKFRACVEYVNSMYLLVSDVQNGNLFEIKIEQVVS